MDFRFAIPQLSLAFRRTCRCSSRCVCFCVADPRRNGGILSVADPRENGGESVDANSSRDVAGVSTGRDAMERRHREQRSGFPERGFCGEAPNPAMLDPLDNGRPAAYLGACRLYYKPPTPVPSIPFRLSAFFSPRQRDCRRRCSFLRANHASSKYQLNPVDRNTPRELWPLSRNNSRAPEC